MRVTPNTVKAAGIVTATVGAGLTKSTVHAVSAIGGAMKTYGTAVLHGKVLAPAVVVVAAAAPVVLDSLSCSFRRAFIIGCSTNDA